MMRKKHTGTKGGQLGGIHITISREIYALVAMPKDRACQQMNPQIIYHFPAA